jgi:hypothetical protein
MPSLSLADKTLGFVIWESLESSERELGLESIFAKPALLLRILALRQAKRRLVKKELELGDLINQK